MPTKRFVITAVCAAFVLLLSANAQPDERAGSVLRVNVTTQAFDLQRPWTKQAPSSREGVGVLLSNHGVLVTAELVANANYVELEKASDGEKMAATVDVVDYEANLALIKPADAHFLAGMKPLGISNAVAGDRPGFWQLESTGSVLETSALVTTVEVGRYNDDTALLVYQLTAQLQYREGSFTLPLIKGGRLCGMLMRYDSRNQSATAIPAPVIAHFLKDAATGSYKGFPRTGLEFSPMRDPQFRRFLGAEKANGGVYIARVQKGGPAERAGVREGDILLTAGGWAVDADGNYDDPTFGELSLVHLFSTLRQHGETIELGLLRSGQNLKLKVGVEHRPASSSLIEPYSFDKAPNYYVLGGLVLQELSRQYLKELPEVRKTSQRLTYYDRFQNELFANDPRKRIIILSQVLPSRLTLGYEEVGQEVIRKINDVEILSIKDVESAVAKPIDGFHKIELEDYPGVIYLDARQVSEQAPLLMKAYGLPSIKGGPAFGE